ncbi:hypothetical protein M5689_024024 [Euphorbia peplus]|nr:hypothetical protein M5689_024024 [Euphorbia peplus]
MAGYGYRSSTPYSSPQTDDWGKTTYASDHVCRPVIVDAEGRKRPIVSFTPNQNSEYYVTRTTETVVQEQILSPYASEMMQPPLWSPEGHGVVEEKWQKHPNSVHDYPPKVDEFVTRVQTEASRPKFGPMSASTWRQTAKPSGYGSEFHEYSNSDKKHTSSGYQNDAYDDNNYGKYGNNNNNNGWNKPNSTNISTASTFYKEPLSPVATHAPRYRHADPVLIDTYNSREATPVMTHGGWVRPTSTTTTWASPPNSNLTKPTSDLPTAIGILKEVAKPLISRYAGPEYTELIDSKEAATRYGNFGKFKSSPKTYSTENNYATTIDSREAARKYHGATV